MNAEIGTVALVVYFQKGVPLLVDVLSDDQEIDLLSGALETGQVDPLTSLYDLRRQRSKEDEDFGNYVEELVCQPFLKPTLKEQGVRWLTSRIRIENYEKCEREARQIIAEYAHRVFSENTKRREFILKGPKAEIRIRVLDVPNSVIQLESTSVESGQSLPAKRAA